MHRYITIHDYYEGIFVEFDRKKNHNTSFLTFKIPASTNTIL